MRINKNQTSISLTTGLCHIMLKLHLVRFAPMYSVFNIFPIYFIILIKNTQMVCAFHQLNGCYFLPNSNKQSYTYVQLQRMTFVMRLQLIESLGAVI